MTSTDHFEAVIVGGGCAGTILAAVLEKVGLHTLVIEQQRYPRFAIGESLTPFGNQILRRLASRYDLGYLDSISRYGSWCEHYPQLPRGLKRGFSYFRHHRHRTLDPGPDHADELLVAASESDELGDTQWLRADMDHWLAERAREVGSEVWEGCSLGSVDRSGSRWTLSVQLSPDSSRRHVVCHGPLFDASGAAAAVARRQGARWSTSGLRTNTRAVYTHLWEARRFEHCLREAGARLAEYPFRCDDAAVHHVVDGGWIWQIRFDDGRVSMGLVENRLDPRSSSTARAEDATDCSQQYPLLSSWLSDSRLAATPGRWLRTRRLQRRLSVPGGEGWLCLPSTYAFVDPLHSTGIAWSLAGIERIGQLLEDSRSLPATSIKRYGSALRHEVGHVDTMIALAYVAMPNWELFRLATLVYFAAATCQERAARPDDAVWGFLQAGNDDFCAAARRLLEAFRSTDVHDAAQAKRLAAMVRRELAPFDRVGLFEPTHPHLYANTAAPYQPS